MRCGRLLLLACTMIVAAIGETSAHKPITSPFTYSADVLPIIQARCSRCHAPGGVAPMSLLTYSDALPWGESLRVELTAGHMPPWSVDRGARRFQNPGNLTARELNVLLTWATGGTPPGDATPDPKAPTPGWTSGRPDQVLSLPAVTVAADEQERVAEFVLPIDSRPLKAVDLLPGTPATVRSATVDIQAQDAPRGIHAERTLGLWVPGDVLDLPAVGSFDVPPGAKMHIRVRYRKTWEYERKTLTDQSQLGLYFAALSAPAIQAIDLSPAHPATLARASRAIALYPGDDLSDAEVTVTATKPNGQRNELIAFHPRRGWARRFWFLEPLPLPAGTTLSVRVIPDAPALLPVLPSRPRPVAPPPTPRVTVNVVM